MTRLPFPKQARHRASARLDLIHNDICGPMQTPSHNMKKYVMTLIDYFTRYTIVEFLETKGDAAFYIKNFVKMSQTQYNKTPRCIRSDRGLEYVNAFLQNFLKSEGINLK